MGYQSQFQYDTGEKKVSESVIHEWVKRACITDGETKNGCVGVVDDPVRLRGKMGRGAPRGGCPHLLTPSPESFSSLVVGEICAPPAVCVSCIDSSQLFLTHVLYVCFSEQYFLSKRRFA